MEQKKETKFSLKPDGSGAYILMIDDKPSICPRTPLSQIPTGQLDHRGVPVFAQIRMACTSACPFFKRGQVKNNEKGELHDGYFITCMDKMNFIQPDIVEPTKGSKLTIKH